MKHRSKAILLLLPLAAAGFAQSIADPLKAGLKALDAGRYLEGIDLLAAAAFDEQGNVRDRSAARLWAQFSPFVTNEIAPSALHQLNGDKPVAPDTKRVERISAAGARNAIDQIVRRARATRIVILNENHGSPRDRAFALEVARAIRPLGYAVLAAEAFTNDEDTSPSPTKMARLAKDKFVRLSTGVYTQDPVFSDFVREALAIGYHPVAYEQTIAQTAAKGRHVEAREQAQAENLMARIFARDPNARVLIYVGHAHVAEAPLPQSNGEKVEWMAARLKRMTGIDPLTIDQTGFTDSSHDTRSAHAEASRRVGDRPGILVEKGHPIVLGRYAGVVDLEIIHPLRAYRYGRPTWIARTGRRPVRVPKSLLPITGRRLIQAFAANAPADAVPLDQVLVTAGQEVPSLMLRDRRVRFATQP